MRRGEAIGHPRHRGVVVEGVRTVQAESGVGTDEAEPHRVDLAARAPDVFLLENVQARARRDALDDQLVADALRGLAFLEVYNRGT